MIVLLCCSPVPALAQGNASEVENLRRQITIQQRQLDEQKSKLEEQQKQLEIQTRALDRISGKGTLQQQVATQEAPSQGNSTPTNAGAIAKKDSEAESFSPLAFRIGGAEFTPGGFLDLSTVWRSTNVGSGVGTAFHAIPANNSTAGKLSESRFSGQNTRLALKITERPLKNVLATGYFEVDFSGALPSTVYVTGNGLGFRLRQAYVNLKAGRFEILGGQAWTLITPNRVGTAPAPSDVFLGLGQDSCYLAGLVFVRQSQVRATFHLTPGWTLAFSIENPQQYVTNATTLPAAFSNQFDTSSGNAAIANPRPDIAAKIAYDGKMGERSMHFEIAGITRQFRTLTSDNIRHSAQGVGGTMTLILEPVKNLRWILTSFYSSGGGRFIMGMGPDAVVSPDGSISPVHSMSGITGFEYQIRPASMAYGYYSGAYFRRNSIPIAPGSYLGFGYPGSSASANRQIQEATAGYAHTFWKTPNFGSFQVMGQYAYITRSPWYVASPADGEMHAHMVFAGLRLTIP